MSDAKASSAVASANPQASVTGDSVTDLPEPVLAARDVVTGYGEVEILHGVTVIVGRGEIVSIIGPNGAGKSTLLRAVMGLLPVWSGSITLNGRDITHTPTEQLIPLGVGFVPQTDNVFPTLTIRENLALGGYARESGVAERIEHVYGLFPTLSERPNEKAGRLSGGQRQLLALGRALMMEPSVLLLDEPSASLSPAMVSLVFDKILEINRHGTAILMVEQNARHALSMSHRAYVLAVGENKFEGAAAGLLESDEVRRLYLGE